MHTVLCFIEATALMSVDYIICNFYAIHAECLEYPFTILCISVMV